MGTLLRRALAIAALGGYRLRQLDEVAREVARF